MLDFLKQFADLISLFFLLGSVLLVFGLIGGDITIKEIRVPRIAGIARALCVGIGLLSIGTSLYLHLNREDPPNGEKPLNIVGGEPGGIEDFDAGYLYFRVCYVPEDDPDGGLVVREKPGVSGADGFHSQVGLIPREARKIKYLGKRANIFGVYWYRVKYPAAPTTGWVNSFYLCPNDGECDCR